MEPRANWQPRRDPARLPQVRPGRAVDRLAGFRCEQQPRRPLPWSARISAILDLHRERRLQLQVPGEPVRGHLRQLDRSVAGVRLDLAQVWDTAGLHNELLLDAYFT